MNAQRRVSYNLIYNEIRTNCFIANSVTEWNASYPQKDEGKDKQNAKKKNNNEKQFSYFFLKCGI